ncbi:MAG: hypothetical protein GY749_11170 [Desulfobacteraceae bacterium]|nr:hypothetical protein [Desulfobacteraceae bacterium]
MFLSIHTAATFISGVNEIGDFSRGALILAAISSEKRTRIVLSRDISPDVYAEISTSAKVLHHNLYSVP